MANTANTADGIVEMAQLRAKPGQADQMRAGLAAARAVLSRAAGYRGSTFHQGIEDPQRFVLSIHWDNVAAHMQGFREGPLFPEWRSHFGQFMDGPADVMHATIFAGGPSTTAQ
jgi:heme-degrading monooxygenase HmoA